MTEALNVWKVWPIFTGCAMVVYLSISWSAINAFHGAVEGRIRGNEATLKFAADN